ncbi:MAG: GldG family protein [Clostridiales bacterium]|nr:GldG family protein [Clostridiales bacterium]
MFGKKSKEQAEGKAEKKKFQLPRPDMAKFRASFRTRNFRVGGYSVVAAAIVLAIAIMVNLFVNALPSSWTQLDTTASGVFSISSQTEQIVSGLEDDVTVYWLVRSGDEDTYLENLLERYESLSDHLTVVKKDPDVYPTFATQYGISSVSDNDLVVECGDRYTTVSASDLYEYDYSSYYTTGSIDVSFAGEGSLTSAVSYVTSDDLPKLYTLTGHGESSLSSDFESALEKENVEIEELSLLTVDAVPEDADCILIYGPSSDISETELELLQEYLSAGGNLILLTDTPEDDGALDNLESLMADYGVTTVDGIVVEGNQSYYAYGYPYYLLPELESHTITSPLISDNYYVLIPIAQGLEIADDLDDSLSVSALLTTSDDAYSKLDGWAMTTYSQESGDIDGPFTLAVAITKTNDDESESKIVWVGSTSLLDDDINTAVSGGNQDFFLNAVNWICGQEESISIRSKSLSSEYLTIDSASASVMTLTVVIVLPVAFLVIGVFIWARRRRA